MFCCLTALSILWPHPHLLPQVKMKYLDTCCQSKTFVRNRDSQAELNQSLESLGDEPCCSLTLQLRKVTLSLSGQLMVPKGAKARPSTGLTESTVPAPAHGLRLRVQEEGGLLLLCQLTLPLLPALHPLWVPMHTPGLCCSGPFCAFS
jgi:hypothetical protein